MEPNDETGIDDADTFLAESVAALPWQIHHCEYNSMGFVTFADAAKDPEAAAWPFPVDAQP